MCPVQSRQGIGYPLHPPETGQFSRLFNPRTDRWEDHFALAGARLVGTTVIGQVTINLLRLNEDERVLERAWLQRLGEFPPAKRLA